MSVALRSLMALWLVGFPGLILLADERFRPEAGQTRATPFRLVSGYLVVVDGSVGNLDRLNFVIDTGTNRTVIDQGVAQTAGLPPTRADMYVFGDRLQTETVVVPSLALGPIRTGRLPVLTHDLQQLEQRFGFRPHALVGMDVLGNTCFTIDYAARSLAFRCIRRWPQEVAFDRRSPYPVVEAIVEGVRYRLIVDSGTAATVIFEHAFPGGKVPKADAEVDGAHLTGSVRLKQFTARRLDLGNRVLPRLPLFTMKSSPDTSGFDGVLAPHWLPGARVHFDFERRVLGWR